MDKDPPDRPRSHFYDVEWFRKLNSESVRKRGRLSRTFSRFSWALDSVQGFFIGMLYVVIIFGTLGIVVVGAYFGPLAFLGLLGGTIGGLAFWMDKKVGGSLQFGDYDMLRKIFAQVLAFGLIMGFMLFIFFILPRMLAFRLF